MSRIVVHNPHFNYGEFAIVRCSKDKDSSMPNAGNVTDKTFMHAGFWHCYKDPQTYMFNPVEFDGIRISETPYTAFSTIKEAAVIQAVSGMTGCFYVSDRSF